MHQKKRKNFLIEIFFKAVFTRAKSHHATSTVATIIVDNLKRINAMQGISKTNKKLFLILTKVIFTLAKFTHVSSAKMPTEVTVAVHTLALRAFSLTNRNNSTCCPNAPGPD
jgi:hypothetical protein